MWQAHTESLNDGRVRRITIARDSSPMSYAQVIAGWSTDREFREFYIALLADAPFDAIFWEAPPITRASIGQPYEFVLVESPALATATPDAIAFTAAFAAASDDQCVVTFENLGRDTLLVAPCPAGPANVYPHLAAFVRGAPEAQHHELFVTLATAIERTLSDRPLWVSTSGLGVYWLHIRLDSRPKYYTFRRYSHASFR
ncbi:MAG: hypothetical protein H0V62_04860 [Gammaproteobacteria bacterium]|nr:hypothetical protein [Gammaproteobacteria bacterium]